MSMPKVAFQGASGAFSEMAIMNFFKYQASPVGYELPEEVTEAVASGQCHYGMLPVENSIAGNVEGHLDTIFAQPLGIIAECYLHVQHCLLGLPGSQLEDLTAVYSHPMAIGQCQKYLRQHQLKGHIDYDTAGACRRLLERQNRREGVIASRRCSELYGLSLLAENIQDIPHNYTRFVLFQQEKRSRPDFSQEGKVSLAFSVKHEPGALLKCLQAFAEHNINLTRLVSRPVPSNPFAYLFHVDCLANVDEPQFRDCISQMRHYATQLRIYGRYGLAPVPRPS